MVPKSPEASWRTPAARSAEAGSVPVAVALWTAIPMNVLYKRRIMSGIRSDRTLIVGLLTRPKIVSIEIKKDEG